VTVFGSKNAEQRRSLDAAAAKSRRAATDAEFRAAEGRLAKLKSRSIDLAEHTAMQAGIDSASAEAAAHRADARSAEARSAKLRRRAF
jgi:hypothetical protein